jgi:para-aminobenzoate synthetase/4-amino-4-deoxychorismate lyase
LKGTFLTGDAGTQSQETVSPVADFELIETMRFDGARIPLLDRHVDRLARSAAYFSFPFDEQRFRRRVERAVKGQDADTILKVRVTLDRCGRLSVTTTPIDGGPTEPWRLSIAEERVDRTDPFFYHKTTRRGMYDRALAAAQEDGYDEAILLNQDGSVTEGTYSNLFVRQGDDLWTPPVSSGLLAGVYRDHVLETQPQASTRTLTLDDLVGADGLYCCNAVRGCCEAELVLQDRPVA